MMFEAWSLTVCKVLYRHIVSGRVEGWRVFQFFQYRTRCSLSVRLEPEPEKEARFWVGLFFLLMNPQLGFLVEKDRTR